MRKQTRPGSKKRPRRELRLYIADTSPRSVLAVGNLRDLCEQYLKTDYRVTIIDIVRQPAQARRHNILATPTLVQVLPQRQTTLIGTLGNTESVLRALGVRSTEKQPLGISPVGQA